MNGNMVIKIWITAPENHSGLSFHLGDNLVIEIFVNIMDQKMEWNGMEAFSSLLIYSIEGFIIPSAIKRAKPCFLYVDSERNCLPTIWTEPKKKKKNLPYNEF